MSKEKSRIIGFMVCGPGEADRYLENSLKEFRRLCDDAVIAGNNTDEKTEALIKSYGYWFYRDDREWGKDQPNIKARLLEKVAKLRPDFIVAIDADEVFAPSFTRESIEELGKTNEIAWYFLVINLYNDDKHYAHDRGIQRFWNVRLYRYRPEFGFGFLNKSLHCGLAPPVYYNFGWHAPYYLLHYGLMTPESRARKAERYKKYDPKAVFKDRVYYDDLEKSLEMRPFDGEKMLRQLAEADECKPRKTPSLNNQEEYMKYFYVKRKKDGKILDIPERDVEATMKTGGFELLKEVPTGKIEVPPAPEATTDGEAAPNAFECPICGFAGKNAASLSLHKRRAH